MQPAIFLDRDGTVVEPRHYPSRPEDLVVYPGIGPRLRQLSEAGFLLVIVTNQSGLARGYFSIEDLDWMHDYLRLELARDGVVIDAIQYCPHHPDGEVPDLACSCDCRKPQPGMLLEAAERLGIDCSKSWMIGDILDDVEAGHRAGCRSLLVDIGTESPPPSGIRTPYAVLATITDALDLIAADAGLVPGPPAPYWPSRWPSTHPLAETSARR